MADKQQTLTKPAPAKAAPRDGASGISRERLIELLTPFDAVFSAAKLSPGEVRWTAGFITPAP